MATPSRASPGPADAPVIVWFRRDLRLADHPAWTAATLTGQPVLPVYVRSSSERTPGAASQWWLHGSLTSLAATIAAGGGSLVLRSGDPVHHLTEIARECGARRLFFNRSFEPGPAVTATRVSAALSPLLEVREFAGDVLHEPGSILSAAGEPLRVFTPFWRACQRTTEPDVPQRAPPAWRQYTGSITSDRLAQWDLLPQFPDWAKGLRDRWRPGQAAAAEVLDDFIESRLAAYGAARDRPDQPGTSRLSPHLHFGEISPRQIWHAVRSCAAGDARRAAGAEPFLRELAWREFSMHLLHFSPDLGSRPLRADFEHVPWRRDPSQLRAWQRGETGYPLVDAGMRELWSTGWMHNRVRMVVASFLVKHLLIDWREGEAWFWDTLVDADSANNAANWQWVAGCGTDAMPYFRIFNPVIQGEKFDPDGVYVRTWVPELARLPARFIHSPWRAPAGRRHAAGVTLGHDYPRPIVDHDQARARALAAYASARNKPARRGHLFHREVRHTRYHAK